MARGDVSSPAASAETQADAIVRDAEREAAEIIAGAETERESLREQKLELERERGLIEEKQHRLSDLLDTAIEELERVSANGSPNVGGLQALRDKLRATE
jgi:F0F1-type ATP synthase membrane subunit b/b'